VIAVAASKGVPKVAKVPSIASRTRQKVHAGAFVHDEAFNEEQHDLGPWMETPRSSRVDAFRYDYLNRALQVTWRNNNNHGYIYLEVPYERYKSMARAASKGRYVNSALNGFEYRLMTPDEVQAQSNAERQGLSSRVLS
jgi:hypothetical protein